MLKKSKSEVGHAKNVTNLGDLIGRCIGYGTIFNPGRAELQLDALQRLYQEAQAILRAVAEAEVIDQQTTNQRKELFKKLRPFVTRIINTMVAYGVSPKSVEDARAIQRRMNGIRASKKENGMEATDTPESAKVTDAASTDTASSVLPRKVSVSRQSYDLLVEHFSKLVLIVQRESAYQPNEPELQLGGLQAFEQQLRSLQEMIIANETTLENVRIQRKKLFYTDLNNLVDRALQVKSYVKGIFGATSPEYRQIAKLTFRRII